MSRNHAIEMFFRNYVSFGQFRMVDTLVIESILRVGGNWRLYLWTYVKMSLVKLLEFVGFRRMNSIYQLHVPIRESLFL